MARIGWYAGEPWHSVKLHVWGDHACFTRPGMKVEHVSYDAMPPSAARGIREATWQAPLVVRALQILSL